MATKYKFFWGTLFSNWYPSEFIVDGVKFNCGEQYMMYQKAKLFGDTNSMNEILISELPREQKVIGRGVKNFKPEVWNEKKYELVKKGLREKFIQNESLLKELLKYKEYQFVEASPYDNIWGIGFDELHALENKRNWGENLLGKIITELCEELSNNNLN